MLFPTLEIFLTLHRHSIFIQNNEEHIQALKQEHISFQPQIIDLTTEVVAWIMQVKLHDHINFEHFALIYSDYIIQLWNGNLVALAQQGGNEIVLKVKLRK